MHRTSLLGLSSAALAIGCAATPTALSDADRAACEDASHKLEACAGAPAVSLDGCDGPRAAAVLAASCDDLARTGAGAGGGKADGASCWAFWSAECWRVDETAVADLLRVHVETCDDLDDVDRCAASTPLPCASVVIERNGEVVGESATARDGTARFFGLPSGNYTARVLRRDGSVTTARTRDRDRPRDVEARAALSYRAARGDTVDFVLPLEERRETYACATVEVPTDLPARDHGGAHADFEWVAQATDCGGTVYVQPECGGDYPPDCKIVIDHVLPGTQTVQVHGISVPWYVDLDRTKSEEYLRDYPAGFGRTWDYTFTLESTDVTGDPDHRVRLSPDRDGA